MHTAPTRSIGAGLAVLITAAGVGSARAHAPHGGAPWATQSRAGEASLRSPWLLTSDAWPDGRVIPDRFTGDAGTAAVSPPQGQPSAAAATRNAVFDAIDGHVLGEAVLVARFHRWTKSAHT